MLSIVSGRRESCGFVGTFIWCKVTKQMPHSLCLAIMPGVISVDMWTLIISGAENPILILYMML